MGGWIAGELGGELRRGGDAAAETGMVQRHLPCKRSGERGVLAEGTASAEVLRQE